MSNHELSMLIPSAAEEEAFLRKGDLKVLLPKYREPSQLLTKDRDDNAAYGIVKDLSDWDILLGRNMTAHPGNVVYRKIVIQNRLYFQAMKDSQKKTISVDALIAFFESNGTRFLEPLGGSLYKEVPYLPVMEKIRKALNEKRANQRLIAIERRGRLKKKTKVVKTSRRETATAPRARGSSSSTTTTSSSSRRTQREIVAGDRLAIFWPEDDVYYPGTVTVCNGNRVRFRYEDGAKEKLDLSRCQYVVLGKSPLYLQHLRGGKTTTATTTVSSSKPQSRRVSLPRETSPGSSSTSASTASSKPKEETTAKRIVLAGTFSKSAVAPAASSFAAFLSSKIQQKTTGA